MNTVRTKAYAKINLTLFISGIKDGYHLLDSVVASVGLYDLVTVKKAEKGNVSITMRGEGSENIPYGENNAVRAAKLFFDEFPVGGAEIVIDKNIPMGAGLGGSSADAAGVLNALSKLYQINDREKLESIADKTGSDTRYMLSGGYARLFGRGEIIMPLQSDKELNILLLVPDEKVSTAQCFKTFDTVGTLGGNSDGAEKALASGDVNLLSKCLSNSLTDAAVTLCGGIKSCIKDLEELGALAVNVTGSGSGVYALFENKEKSDCALSRYRGKAKIYSLQTTR